MNFLIFDKEVFKILTIFSLMPGGRFFRKELKEKTKMNNVTLDAALNILINARIIIKKGRYLSLNLENSKQILDIIKNNYKKLKELPINVYFSIIDFVSFISRFGNIEVYLFGSYSKLVYKDTSDIDIAIISTNNLNRKMLAKSIQKIEKRFNKAVEIHYFDSNFYKNKKDPLVNDILKNGIKLI